MVVISGKANLVYEDVKGLKHKLVEIRTGDCFGLSDLLQINVSFALLCN